MIYIHFRYKKSLPNRLGYFVRDKKKKHEAQLENNNCIDKQGSGLEITLDIPSKGQFNIIFVDILLKRVNQRIKQ